MAAETPQMETALERMAAKLSSIPILRQSQKLKYQTTITTRMDWSMPRAPAARMSLKRMVAPMRMRPVLM